MQLQVVVRPLSDIPALSSSGGAEVKERLKGLLTEFKYEDDASRTAARAAAQAERIKAVLESDSEDA